MEWLGNVGNVDGERTAKKLLNGKPGGGRRKGRLILRRMDNVELDFRNLGVKTRRTRVLGRTEWASVVRQNLKGFGQDRVGICHEAKLEGLWAGQSGHLS